MTQNRHGARRADRPALAAQVLVPAGAALVRTPQRTAGRARRAARLERHWLWAVREMHIEGVGPHVDDRVCVQLAAPALARLADMNEAAPDVG
ncbi:hypothetical protein AB5J52_41430 [Streptomyces sp. R39]|uniref:Uncharacterized protein n=1 Tax=Streptomyces sp. R39 TaxID=3238631 RepID=A0AB39QX17_9ACTN